MRDDGHVGEVGGEQGTANRVVVLLALQLWCLYSTVAAVVVVALVVVAGRDSAAWDDLGYNPYDWSLDCSKDLPLSLLFSLM